MVPLNVCVGTNKYTVLVPIILCWYHPHAALDILHHTKTTKQQCTTRHCSLQHTPPSPQVNLDFESESDMMEKFRLGLALQPITTALFANSPFKERQPTGYLSWRSHVWTDTDPDRCGHLPFVFEDGFGFERYVDYALDVPMYFVYRNGTYHNALGQSFRDFMKGQLPALPGRMRCAAAVVAVWWWLGAAS